MITNATITSYDSSPRLYRWPGVARGEMDYPVSARDLIEFGRSPARWVATKPPEEEEKPSLNETVRLLHLAPALLGRLYVIRPETYEAMVPRCPKCNSTGTGAVCRKCGLTRKNVTEQKPWHNAAEFCAKWTEEHTRKLHHIIPHRLSKEAEAIADALEADVEINALNKASQLSVAMVGEWEDEDTGLKIPLRGVLSYIPADTEVRDDSFGSLSLVRDASPNAWAASAYAQGQHIAAAFKQDLANVATKGQRTQHLWALAETEPPYLVARRRTTPELLATGRNAYGELIKAYARCLQAGEWPMFEPLVAGSIDSWAPLFVQPWMTQNTAQADRYFGVSAAPAAAAA
jgi:hypothetical protein